MIDARDCRGVVSADARRGPGHVLVGPSRVMKHPGGRTAGVDVGMHAMQRPASLSRMLA